MRARPEPTRLEYLSDASFLGELMVHPPNVRLDWQVIAIYKHSSLFGLIISEGGKKFYNIDTKCRGYKSFLLVADGVQNKLERLSLTFFFNVVYYLRERTGAYPRGSNWVGTF